MRKMITGITLLLALLAFGIMPGFAQDDSMMDSNFEFFATLNPADGANDMIISFSADLMTMTRRYSGFSSPVTRLESIAYGADGMAYLTFDVADGAGGLVVLTGQQEAPILGASTMLMAPKGLEVIDSLGVVVVANFGGNNILTFPIGAAGDIAPTGVIDNLGGAGSVWDVTYDHASDTLFAAGTAGDVLVYEGFSESMGDRAPTRIISPSNAANEKVSINLHGLVYLSEDDVLILSDVGAADNNTDGHLYVIENASEADSNATVALHITGEASHLGNPVDLLWDGSGVYVAEKANDAILYFPDLLSNSGMMDASATWSLQVSKPESLALTARTMDSAPVAEMTDEATAEMTEMPTAEPTAMATVAPTTMPTTEPTAMATTAPTAMPTTEPTAEMTEMPTAEPTAMATAAPTSVPTAEVGGSSVFVASNPGDITGDSIINLSGDLAMRVSAVGGFSGITSIQSVKFDSTGNAYMTVDVSDGVGALVSLDGLAGAGGGALGDISGLVNTTASGLNAPKGLEIIESLDLVLVANFGAGNIRGYSLDATGGLPTVSINNIGDAGGSVWDIHYDETTDTLFAAGTSGTLIIYDDFRSNLGSGGPTRFIVPGDAAGNQISVNLHGVDYDAATDTVFLSDVGSADSNSDGQIFVIAQTQFANGVTPARAILSGANTMLGNPVDIDLVDGDLYVAEKANDAILVYEDILSRTGALDVVAETVASVIKPESVTVYEAE